MEFCMDSGSYEIGANVVDFGQYVDLKGSHLYLLKVFMKMFTLGIIWNKVQFSWTN